MSDRPMEIVDVPVPRCTVCDAPYVLRFAMQFSGGTEWLYQRDCKHKTGTPTGGADMETAPLRAWLRADA